MAGISNGALYKYFINKEDLFFSVLDYGVSLIVNELYAKYTVNTTSIFEAISSFLVGLVQFSKVHSDHLTIYCDSGSSSMKRFAASASEKFESMASMYTIKLVEESKNRGEIDQTIGSDVAAYLIDSHITFFVHSLVSDYHCKRFDSFYTNGRTLSVEERIQIIIESLRQTLK